MNLESNNKEIFSWNPEEIFYSELECDPSQPYLLLLFIFRNPHNQTEYDYKFNNDSKLLMNHVVAA